jgi:hypothetical protein
LDRLTTTIKRPWLAEIIAGTNKIEYREIKPYWRDRLAQVKVPFELRLINGMQRRAPEVTVLINKVKKDTRNGVYELHIRKVISFMNWDHSGSVRR